MGCKLSLALFQYCTMANFCWLLAEGLHLHTLLVAVPAPPRRLLAYLLLGWGKDAAAPVTPAGAVQRDGRAHGHAAMALEPRARDAAARRHCPVAGSQRALGVAAGSPAREAEATRQFARASL